MKKRLFSGIQPSGILHIGNYLGAIKQWVELQENHEAFFCVVDEHAITVPQDPKELPENTLGVAMMYLAAGIDPERSTVFVQSHVPAHAELAWILNTITPLGELKRMTQFKDKANLDTNYIYELKQKIQKFSGDLETMDTIMDILNDPFFNIDTESIMAGLLNYPVLMAADILLYQTDIVPVGEDQKQHIELARSLAKRFNNRFGNTFRIPQGFISKETARIMGLDDPTKKMSKSAPSQNNYIALLDAPDEIRRKIKIAVTDSGKEIIYDPGRKLAISNLLVIFSEFSGESINALEKRYQGKGYAEFKSDVAEAVVRGLTPLQQKFSELKANEPAVLKILKDGSQKAAEIANKTLRAVKERIGFLL